MNKQTLENLLIFAVVYCNTYKLNKGKPYTSYISEKSIKYIGIDITEHSHISIVDFSTPSIIIKNTNEFERDPLLPGDILERLKYKIKLSDLSGYENIIDDGIDIFGNEKYRINGLDSGNAAIFKNIYDLLDEEYFKRISRKYNIHIILDEDD